MNSLERVLIVLTLACGCSQTKLLNMKQLGWGKGILLPALSSSMCPRESSREKEALRPTFGSQGQAGVDRAHTADADRAHIQKLTNKCRLME